MVLPAIRKDGGFIHGEEVIEVYIAYRRCHLELTEAGRDTLPNFGNPADATRAWAEVWEAEQKIELALVEAQPKIVLAGHVQSYQRQLAQGVGGFAD